MTDNQAKKVFQASHKRALQKKYGKHTVGTKQLPRWPHRGCYRRGAAFSYGDYARSQKHSRVSDPRD